MHIGLLATGAGSHVSGWRMPDAEFGGMNLDLACRVAQVAERGKLDFVFYADAVATDRRLAPAYIVRLEPLTLLAALAMTTSRIGLVATASTTYSQPYNLARLLASVDHISKGRAGWNVVTSTDNGAAQNFGIKQHPEKSLRYKMAEEYLDVVKGLWDSVETEALVGDKDSGVYVDTSKMHDIDHEGEFYSVKGPLNMVRPPQGAPVIFQAGASDTGIAFAGRTAEVVFAAQNDQEGAKALKAKFSDACVAAGRAPDAVKLMCGVCPIVADTKEEALAMVARLGELMDPVSAMKTLTERMGEYIAEYPLDEPLPELSLDGAESHGHAKQFIKMATRDKLTLRQLRDIVAMSAGHRVVIGTPEEVADDLESWFRSGATDGFALMTPWQPGPLTAFVDKVIPILVERGLFRADYSGSTLREHLGLDVPANQFVRQPEPVEG
jgi:FMN-dependent oxidoreductase (nitrilotriacetate monooxygenase family)